VHPINFQTPSPALARLVGGATGVLADPPRSGLLRFPEILDGIAERPRHFVYVSCYPESFATDAARLAALGYRLRTLEIVDQFPQTPHAELVSRFEGG
jgi:23S rRNA (uracil1939-C5)-methyltransferase